MGCVAIVVVEVAGVAIVVVYSRGMYYCTVICLIWFEIHFIIIPCPLS